MGQSIEFQRCVLAEVPADQKHQLNLDLRTSASQNPEAEQTQQKKAKKTLGRFFKT